VVPFLEVVVQAGDLLADNELEGGRGERGGREVVMVRMGETI
jgi:hypothetical protein